jgi:hypothetical protein
MLVFVAIKFAKLPVDTINPEIDAFVDVIFKESSVVVFKDEVVTLVVNKFTVVTLVDSIFEVKIFDIVAFVNDKLPMDIFVTFRFVIAAELVVVDVKITLVNVEFVMFAFTESKLPIILISVTLIDDNVAFTPSIFVTFNVDIVELIL